MPRRFWSGLRASSNVVAALKPAASTTPVSSRRAGVQLPRTVRDGKDQQGRRHRAAKSGEIDSNTAEPQHDGEQCGDSRTARAAEDVRLSERIAQ